MNVSRSKRINAAPDVVWRVIASADALAHWYPGGEESVHLAGPKEGVGRRQRLKRSLYGRVLEVELEVAAWEPGRLLALRHVRETVEGREVTGVRNFQTIVRLQPAGQRTAVTLAYQWRSPVGIAWLQSLLGGRVMGKELNESLRRIEQLATGEGK
jgi:carbon monoxide dehydrogenase subunit G